MEKVNEHRRFGVGDEFSLSEQSLDERFVMHKAATFFFTYQGRDMTPLIMPGDVLIVDRSLPVKSGHIVVVETQGRFICRRLVGESLVTDKMGCDVMSARGVSFFGVVTGVARDLL